MWERSATVRTILTLSLFRQSRLKTLEEQPVRRRYVCDLDWYQRRINVTCADTTTSHLISFILTKFLDYEYRVPMLSVVMVIQEYCYTINENKMTYTLKEQQQRKLHRQKNFFSIVINALP